MKNPDFKKNTVFSTAAFALAVILLAAACVIPETVIKRLERKVMTKIDNAIELVEREEYQKAEPLVNEILDSVEHSVDYLELFFAHEAVYELYCAALSANAITPTGDPSQTLEELCALKTALEYLVGINEASLKNLF